MSDISNVDTATEPVAPSDPGTEAPAALTPGDSATPPTDGTPPPADTQDEGDKPKAPAGLQKSINRLTRQRGEAERRAIRAEAELEALRKVQQPPPAQTIAPPKQSDFASYDEYVKALAEQHARKVAGEAVQGIVGQFEQQNAQRQAEQARDSFLREATTQAKAANIDFEDVWDTLTSAPNLSEPVAVALFESDNKALVAQHLAENPDELERLSFLSPVQAVRELAKLDLQMAKPGPRTTKAPAPVGTVRGSATPTEDPRRMSMDDYAKWRTGR